MFVGLSPCIDSLATTCYPGSFAGIFLSPSCSLFFHGFLRKVIRNDKKHTKKTQEWPESCLAQNWKVRSLLKRVKVKFGMNSVLGRPRLQSIWQVLFFFCLDLIPSLCFFFACPSRQLYMDAWLHHAQHSGSLNSALGIAEQPWWMRMWNPRDHRFKDHHPEAALVRLALQAHRNVKWKSLQLLSCLVARKHKWYPGDLKFCEGW